MDHLGMFLLRSRPALFLAASLLGCTDTVLSAPPSDDTASTPDPIQTDVAGDEESDAAPPAKLCTPGDLKSCSHDSLRVLFCNESGDGYETRRCEDDRGASSFCSEGRGCLPCLPGRTRCLDEDVVEICQEDGSGFVSYWRCTENSASSGCFLNSCMELCQVGTPAGFGLPTAKRIAHQSSMGCHYWLADLAPEFEVVVVNPHKSHSASIEVFDSGGVVERDSRFDLIDKSPIPPGGQRTYALPRAEIHGTGLAPVGYEIRSSVPVAAIQLEPGEADAPSADAGLLLSINVLTTYYVAMVPGQISAVADSYLAIVGISETPTEVSITVTGPTLPNEALGIPALEAGGSMTRVLNQFDVLRLQSAEQGDLTGSVVLSTNRVAVFVGADRANADHLGEQLPAVYLWGFDHVAARSPPRGASRDRWRILAAQEGTHVDTVPTQATIPMLDVGEWFEIESDQDFMITSNKPILVSRVLTAQAAPALDDRRTASPEELKRAGQSFSLLAPIVGYRNDHLFVTPQGYEADYVTAMVRTTASDLFLDGIVIAPDEMTPVGTGEYSVVTRALAPGVHRMASDEPFGVSLYGFSASASYSYPGGF